MKPYALILLTLALVVAHVTAQAIDTEDVPSTCQSVCAPVIAASDACEELEDEDEDASEWVCVCASQGMSTAMPECLSCVQSAGTNGSDDDDDDEGNIIAGMGSCGFNAAPVSSSVAATGQESANSGVTSTRIVTQTEAGDAVVATTGTPATAAGSGGNGGIETSTTLVGSPAGTPSAGSSSADTSSPATTAGPTQATDGSPVDLEGSSLTIVTATIGSGDDAMVATLTSVVPGPVVTSDAADEQLNNGGTGSEAPVGAALFGFAVAFL